MAHSQYERVSVFREAAMAEIDRPKLTPRSSHSTLLVKQSTKEPCLNHKPFILRSVPLLCLLALTLALIGVGEYAIMQLPHASLKLKKRSETVYYKEVDMYGLTRRSANASGSASFSVVATTATTAPSAYVVPDWTTSMALGYTPSVLTDTGIAVSAYVDTESTLVFSSMEWTAFVKTAKTTTSTDSADFVALAADTTAYVEDEATSTSSLGIMLDTIFHAYVSPSRQTTVVNHHDPPRPTMQSPAATTATTAYVPTGTTHVPTPGPDGGNDDEQSSDDGEDGQGLGEGDLDEFDDQGASRDELQQGKDVVVVMRTWDAWRTFLANYIAIVVAVLYRILWVTLWNAFNLIEPFRQLVSPEGALAERALFAFYQNQSNLLGPIPALVRRRWALAIVGAAYLVANLMPALASQSIFVDTNWDCPEPELTDDNNPCRPRISANATVLRVMQGMLGFMAVVILFTTSLLLFNRTGLSTKPNSIAAVASLMRHPRLLTDLCEVPVDASSEQMQRHMRGKRYRLGHYTCVNGLAGYGIVPLDGYAVQEPAASFGISKHRYEPVEGSFAFSDREDIKVHRFQSKDFILAFFVLGAFGVVLAYYLDGSHSGFNNFFNSNTFGTRFILTLAGTVIASLWKSVEQDAIAMAPYFRLAARRSAPGSTILMTPSSTPISSTFRSLRNGYFYAGTVTILTLAAEGLNVVISGVPYAKGQTLQQYHVSAYMSLGILGGMIVVSGLNLLLRLREPRIPRKPTTLGAVMSYLCGSRMLDDLEGTECLDEKARDQRVRLAGKKYTFSETIRRDDKLAWTIDEAHDRFEY